MAIALVQAAENVNTSISTITVASGEWVSNNTAGNGFIIVIWGVGAVDDVVNSITITNESAPTLAIGPQRGDVGGDDYTHWIYYLSDITTGSEKKQFVATMNQSIGSMGMYVFEVSGQDTTDMADGGTVTDYTTGSPSKNITTSNANSAIFGVISSSGSGTAQGTNYTLVTSPAVPNTYYYDRMQYDLDAGAAGAVAFDWSGGSVTHLMTGAAFKVPAPEGGIIPQAMHNYKQQQ